ncbi:MAG: ATP-binding protein [Ignavibacteriaceae bacterium]|nr:ATP-binding protein [Ignavibacteriaceae bacterium]
MITRLAQNRIIESLFKGKAIIIYGARQVGKTTIAKSILEKFGDSGRYLNCETLTVEQALSEPEPEKIKKFLGDYRIIVLDEAQHIPDIGRKIKLIVDEIKDVQIIATGSSSFDIANRTTEPMTGRVFHHTIFPLSLNEIKDDAGGLLGVEAKLENLLIYGSYPEVYLSNEEAARTILSELTSSYLFKDLFRYEGIKKSSMLKNLLMSLAFQVGSDVSYNELGTRLGLNYATVQKYIDLLEQSFVVFRLNSFSRNLRNELAKSVKIYFYDNGVRNALVNNFNPLNIRDDIGALWENFCVTERRKMNATNNNMVNSYFWRTYDQKEVDYVEEAGGKITGFEFKYSEKQKVKTPVKFTETYNAEVKKIDRSNYWEFLIQL